MRKIHIAGVAGVIILLVAVAFLVSAVPALAVTPRNIAVSRVGSTSATLVVETDVASDVRVDFGASPGSYSSTASDAGLIRHELFLGGLPASSNVYYTVTITNSANPSDAQLVPEHSFRTARTPGVPFSFTVSGDNRPGPGLPQPAVWNTIVSQMAVEDPDLNLHVGDMIYGSGTDTLAQNVAKYDDFFGVMTQLTASSPFYPSVGNHEWISSASNRAGYEQEFTLPVNNGADAATDGEEYYSFDSGDTHFVVACSELPGQEGYIIGNQLAWLEQDLASTTKRWKVVMFHRPLYGASGLHASDPWFDTTNVAGQQNRAQLQALFKQYGVAAVFNGHDHYYFHHDENGVQYVITGGGGAPLYPLPAMGSGDIYGASTFEHVRVDETASTLRVTAIDSGGATLESFTLGTPSISLGQNRVYWESYADYLARSLSVDYSLSNSGGDTTNMQFVYLAATNGVAPLTPMPLPLPDLPSGGSVAATIHYQVPDGVSLFRTVSYLACSDLSGQNYQLPGPAPIV